MATRSRIGIEMASGKIKSVYCHSDGYPSYTGKRLLQYYDGDPAKVRRLINVGYLSVLEPTPEESRESAHNKGIKPTTSDSPDAFYEYGREYCGSEFVYYLQRDGMWLGSVVTGNKPDWKPIDMLLTEFD